MSSRYEPLWVLNKNFTLYIKEETSRTIQNPYNGPRRLFLEKHPWKVSGVLM